MASRILDLFGYRVEDESEAAQAARADRLCPFIGSTCTKTGGRDREPLGVCSLLSYRDQETVIVCPQRLYAQNYMILKDVAVAAFGDGVQLVKPGRRVHLDEGQRPVVVFGHRWGQELRLPQRDRKGSFFVDWILALLDEDWKLSEFVAVEVQSIDTTGTYRAQRDDLMAGRVPDPEYSSAGFNWENVIKRIMPQLIYKGQVLRRERLCSKGLFFVCPTPVYNRMQSRLGHEMESYHPGQGTLSFRWYNLDNDYIDGQPRSLVWEGQFTTTIDQAALALTAPRDLPEQGVYEQVIRDQLRHL